MVFHWLYLCKIWFIISYVRPTDYFVLRCGVRQGSVLLPYLFAVYVDNLIEYVSDLWPRLSTIIKRYCMSILPRT